MSRSFHQAVAEWEALDRSGLGPDPLRWSQHDRTLWEEAGQPALPRVRARQESSTMAAMNAENSAAWDRWATVLVRRELAAHQVATVEFVVTRLQDFASLIGAETGRNERGLRAKIKELEEEVASLRADVTIQQRIASGHVIDH